MENTGVEMDVWILRRKKRGLAWNVFLRGLGLLTEKNKMTVKNPNDIPFASTHTYQRCDDCGYKGYAENFKSPLWSTCPKCGSQELTVI